MSRCLAGLFVIVGVGLMSGCGGTHAALVPTNEPAKASQGWVERVTREPGSAFGDPHARVSRFETVQLAATGARADVIEIRGHFHLLPTCVPGAAGHCPGVVHFHNVQVVLSAETHKLISFGNDGTDAELAAFRRARRASRLFESFPDLSGLTIDCNVPSQLVRGGASGTCTTWAVPARHESPARVLFIAHWPLSRPSGSRQVAGWAVTVAPSGRVDAVHRHLHSPPQLWR